MKLNNRGALNLVGPLSTVLQLVSEVEIMSKGKRNKRKKRTPIQCERDIKRSCLYDSNPEQYPGELKGNLITDDMATNSSEATKSENMQQHDLIFDETSDTKELLKNLFSKFNTMLDEVRDINRKQDKILARMTVLEGRVDEQDRSIGTLKKEVENIKQDFKRDFDPEVTLVVTNPPRHAKDNPQAYSHRLIAAVGQPATIVKVLHTEPRENSKGVLKIQLESKDEKVDILRHKSTLKATAEFKHVYIRSSKSHTDRVMDYNFKTLIAELMPDSVSEYRIAGNGKIIKKPAVSDAHQAVSGEHFGANQTQHGILHGPPTIANNREQGPHRVQFSAGDESVKPKQSVNTALGPVMSKPPYSMVNSSQLTQNGFAPSQRTANHIVEQRQSLHTPVGLPTSQDQSRSQTQMNFHGGSGNGSYSHTSHSTSPSILQPTVPPFLPKHMANRYSTPNPNSTQNALDGSTYY